MRTHPAHPPWLRACTCTSEKCCYCLCFFVTAAGCKGERERDKGRGRKTGEKSIKYVNWNIVPVVPFPCSSEACMDMEMAVIVYVSLSPQQGVRERGREIRGEEGKRERSP